MITLRINLDPDDPSSLTHQVNGSKWVSRWEFIRELDEAIAHVEQAAKFANSDQIVIKIAIAGGE